MKWPSGWMLVFLTPGFVGCGLGVFNSVSAIRGTDVQLQGISVQIAALSVIIVASVFFLTALVLTRMDSIRRDTLLAVGDEGRRERDRRIKKMTQDLLKEMRADQ